jgi:hypothetical protein
LCVDVRSDENDRERDECSETHRSLVAMETERVREACLTCDTTIAITRPEVRAHKIVYGDVGAESPRTPSG